MYLEVERSWISTVGDFLDHKGYAYSVDLMFTHDTGPNSIAGMRTVAHWVFSCYHDGVFNSAAALREEFLEQVGGAPVGPDPCKVWVPGAP